MLTASVFNWTGHILQSPRTKIVDALKRDEARYTGIYLLIGESNGNRRIYVGEAEDVSVRIRDHDAKKEWWETVIIVTTSANNLNKAHVRYLESRLCEIAKSVGRFELDNGNNPQGSKLSEAEKASMEEFLHYLLMVLPALQIDAFLQNKRPTSVSQATTLKPIEVKSDTPHFELQNQKHGVHATAIVYGNEFIVQKGSTAKREWTEMSNKYLPLHAELVKSGILAQHSDGKLLVFTENYAFTSPSPAASVINACSMNGPKSWKVKGQKTTYQEWEQEQLNKNIKSE
jgi:hypothetical protein